LWAVHMKASKILIVQNDETETLGLYEQYLMEKGLEYLVHHAYSVNGEGSFPSVWEHDAFIIGPTPIPANDYEVHAFLREEWRFLGEVIGSGKPCLGVCCGAQLLAKRLGAEVRRSPEKEVGGYHVRLTEGGRKDPLFAGFPPTFPVFQWHSDMFEAPPGGATLAEGSPCPIQAFGWGKVRGVIFHLETERREAERWADAHPEGLDAVGKTKEQVLKECEETEPEMGRLARLLMDNFLGL